MYLIWKRVSCMPISYLLKTDTNLSLSQTAKISCTFWRKICLGLSNEITRVSTASCPIAVHGISGSSQDSKKKAQECVTVEKAVDSTLSVEALAGHHIFRCKY